jgi:2-desacetyl-2-hydroxyethyl bacteriochlorophyllide A dehydrogenase
VRRLLWAGAEHFRVETYSALPSAGEGQVLLRVRAVGICGTDIHILNGRLPGVNPPLVLGHEFAGEVLETGPGVTRVKSGDRVTVDSVVGCGKCVFCLRGSRQFCRNGYEFGISRDGACQDLLVVPEENVYPVSDRISFEEAAILDMEVYAALCRCSLRSGAAALVVGDGPAGLIACQILRVMGAGRVILCGTSPARLSKAKSLVLADAFVDATSDDLAEVVERETDGMGVEFAGDFVGTAQSAGAAFRSLVPGGTALLYGVHEAPLDQFDLNQIVLRDLKVFGALSDRVGWERVIQLVESGQLRLKPLITHSFPLERGAEAFALVRHRADGVVKAVITS